MKKKNYLSTFYKSTLIQDSKKLNLPSHLKRDFAEKKKRGLIASTVWVFRCDKNHDLEVFVIWRRTFFSGNEGTVETCQGWLKNVGHRRPVDETGQSSNFKNDSTVFIHLHHRIPVIKVSTYRRFVRVRPLTTLTHWFLVVTVPTHLFIVLDYDQQLTTFEEIMISHLLFNKLLKV